MSKNETKLTTKVSSLISGQVPDFVQSDHTLFIKFLKDYEKKRKLDVVSLINATHALNELFRNSKPYIKTIRRLGLSTVSNAPFLKRAFMKYAMGI